ncbi:rhoGEF domain-containing protein gxcJ-like isoform X2 [Apis florea]|uniref:rhoGEF domain-containing protein gxcJ-like isoform X2 n=1 Tax=Apis florea TaxID=7463 RepID=UPI0006290524|nr:rhoGEF domain-containing protein gxcJ-like isoform X2 [Apis florea]
MSRHRRRANDFIDSLDSFRHSEIDTDSLCSISQDNSNEIESKYININDSIISDDNNKYSFILANNSLKHSFTENLSIFKSAPDLNKRIDFFQVEQLCTEINDNKENHSPQCSMKNNNICNKLSNTIKKQNIDSNIKLESNIINENSKRDTNHNINNNKTNVSLFSEYQDKHINNGTFEAILCSLDDQVNQIRDKKQIWKRLSNKFMHSPENFTEKLLTIIEESVINNDNDVNETSAIDLSRLTTEFRKMCKFIENESQPEWPESPVCTLSSLEQISINSTHNTPLHMKQNKNEKLCSPLNKSTTVTPISGVDIIKKRFFAKISKNNTSGSIENLSSTSFEHLEAQCNQLFPKEKEHSKTLCKSLSMSSLLSMSEIYNKCEQQMASLNVSMADITSEENILLNTPKSSNKYLCQSPSSIFKKKLEFNCSTLKELHNKSKDDQCNDISYSKKKSKKISEKPDFSKTISDKFKTSFEILDPDELEKTLLQDIAEKRKRCLNTARIISEINADPETIEAQKTLRISPDNESNSLNDETKFLQTLVSCKDYQAYLEKHKPLLKILQNSNSNASENSFRKTKKPDIKFEENSVLQKKILGLLSPNVKSCNLHRSSQSKKQKEKIEEKIENKKPKLFVTPGETPPNKSNKKKKVYFPNMQSPVKHIVKSPHAEGLYRLNYNTIISPVGMYIRGTDTQLIKNVHAKTDHLLLTPVKKKVEVSLSRNSKQNISSKGIHKTEGIAPLKINLSPKVNTNKQEITGNKSCKQGTRVKKLLETAQNKIVIRHQSRINSAQKEKGATDIGMYEINYEPEDESIHIEQTANKTNFINKWKN